MSTIAGTTTVTVKNGANEPKHCFLRRSGWTLKVSSDEAKWANIWLHPVSVRSRSHWSRILLLGKKPDCERLQITSCKMKWSNGLRHEMSYGHPDWAVPSQQTTSPLVLGWSNFILKCVWMAGALTGVRIRRKIHRRGNRRENCLSWYEV